MNYEVGRAYKATVNGKPDIDVFRVEGATSGAHWVTASPLPGGGFWYYDADVTDVRPLVVLDLDEITSHFSRGREDLSEVLRALRREGHISSKKIADQIEAQTKPPRIPEPGLWGVVEASFPGARDGKRLRFLRDVCCTDDDWQALTRVSTDGNRGRYSWAALIDPVLVRPGIEEES